MSVRWHDAEVADFANDGAKSLANSGSIVGGFGMSVILLYVCRLVFIHMHM